MTIAPIEAALAGETEGLDAKHESGISSEYSLNTLETTMTPNETSPDQAVEAAIAEVNSRFPDWEPTPDMLGYARAVATAIPTPPPADHPEALDRLRRVGKAQFGDERMFTVQDAEAICAYIDALQAHASPRDDLPSTESEIAEAVAGLVTMHKRLLEEIAASQSSEFPVAVWSEAEAWKDCTALIAGIVELERYAALHASPRDGDMNEAQILRQIVAAVAQYRNAPFRSADWLASELMAILDCPAARTALELG